MEQSYWKIFGKGLVIGATMIVPGVSGGTMAMILGIYDRLLEAVSSFFENPKTHFLFLVMFVIGAAAGLLGFSVPLSWLLKHFELPTLYFFIGAVAGGIPLIGKKSGVRRVTLSIVGYMLCGTILVLLISMIPENLFAASASKAWLALGLAGIFSAAALILPGISFSHVLLIFGLHEKLLQALQSLEINFLLPLGAGLLLGIILFTKFLEHILKKFPKQTYMIILGFIIGSVAQIFPGIPFSSELLIALPAAVAGFFLTNRQTPQENL